MSVVYRARDTQLKRDVAIKVMHAFLAEQPEAKERFHREAVAVARLRHPNIIEIFDYSGEDAQTSYIVMELINGVALADAVKDGPLPCPEAALVLARPIADALECAHRGGVVHRDFEAREHSARADRRAQAHRLRYRAHSRQSDDDHDRHAAGVPGVHGARVYRGVRHRRSAPHLLFSRLARRSI